MSHTKQGYVNLPTTIRMSHSNALRELSDKEGRRMNAMAGWILDTVLARVQAGENIYVILGIAKE